MAKAILFVVQIENIDKMFCCSSNLKFESFLKFGPNCLIDLFLCNDIPSVPFSTFCLFS